MWYFVKTQLRWHVTCWKPPSIDIAKIILAKNWQQEE
jgi:hypothetical protein